MYDSISKRSWDASIYPGVAKFGIALEWGSRGLEFESRHSDQKSRNSFYCFCFFLLCWDSKYKSNWPMDCWWSDREDPGRTIFFTIGKNANVSRHLDVHECVTFITGKDTIDLHTQITKSSNNYPKIICFFLKKYLLFLILHVTISRSEIKVSPLWGREPYRRSNRRMNA